MPAIVACPKCSQKMRVPTDKGELTIRCPACKHSWDWPVKEAGASASVQMGSRQNAPVSPPTPNDVSPRAQLAWELAKKANSHRIHGDYDQAIADCTQAIRLDPSVGFAFGMRGQCLLSKGIIDEAIADSTEAIRLDPLTAFNYETRAECYRLIGNFDLAMADCNQVIRLVPVSALAYRTRAGLHLKAMNLEATIADCNEAIRLDPNSWSAYKAYARRGIAYKFKGDYETAIADCSEAIRLYPHDGLAFLGRADALLIKGDTGRAIQDCTEAIRLNAKDGMAFKSRGMALLAKGDFDEAIADCTEALRINPKIISARSTRGDAHRMKNDLDRAFADYSDVIRLDPDDLHGWCMRGHIHAQRGDLTSAVADLIVGNQLKPSGQSNEIALAQLHNPPQPFSIPQVLMDADAIKSRVEESHQVTPKKGDLLHYILNAGTSSIVARAQVLVHAIDQVRGMLVPGRHLITMVRGGYECEVTQHDPGLLVRVFHRQRVLLIFGVAPNNETPAQVWQELESAYRAPYSIDLTLQTPVRCPEHTPWCATLVGNVRQDETWVSAFEQMMTWAWIGKIEILHDDGNIQAEDSQKPSAQKNELLHHTMNTGHSVFVPRTFVPDGAVKAAKDMLVSGKHPITYFGNNGYECDVTIVKHGLMATVYQGKRPLVNFGVAPDALSFMDLSFVMIGNYALFQKGQNAEQALASFPKVIPWCAVILLSDRQDEMWVANFEQMLAWAWIEKVRAQDAK